MLRKLIRQSKSSVGSRVHEFGRSLQERPPFFSRDSKLVFLCGANQSLDKPSERRSSLKKFMESSIDNCKVIYAESVFEELSKNGRRENILDMEFKISEIADKIMIVLESPSAFCELGAFAHKELRDKLIVINDKRFENEHSFVNNGPIAAARETRSPVLWYYMDNGGINKVDAIGDLFYEIKSIMDSYSPKRDNIFFKDNKLFLATRKNIMYLIHDILYIMGPVSYGEIVSFLVAAFGDSDYKNLSAILGVLRASGFIANTKVLEEGKGDWIYKSLIKECLLKYNFNLNPLMASMRRENLRINPNRFDFIKGQVD